MRPVLAVLSRGLVWAVFDRLEGLRAAGSFLPLPPALGRGAQKPRRRAATLLDTVKGRPTCGTSRATARGWCWDFNYAYNSVLLPTDLALELPARAAREPDAVAGSRPASGCPLAGS